MAMSIAKSFTATGVGGAIGVRRGDSFAYSVSGTFVGTVMLEQSDDGVNYRTLSTFTAGATGTFNVSPGPIEFLPLFRFRCDAYTSGTIVTSVTKNTKVLQQFINEDGFVPLQVNDDGCPTLVRLAQSRFLNTGAKVGTTAGVVVNPANNKAILATAPQSQTASTMVLPINNLKVGDTLTGFSLQGNVLSAGGTVTVDAALRTLTPAAAGATDAAVTSGAITQVSVVANTLLSAVNAAVSGLAQTIVAGVSYYLLITLTTGASCSFELEGVVVNFNEA